MVWVVIHAPALQDSLENTVRGISMNAYLDPATPLVASTACSWSMITSVTVALDTQVHKYSLLNGTQWYHVY